MLPFQVTVGRWIQEERSAHTFSLKIEPKPDKLFCFTEHWEKKSCGLTF